MGMQGGRTIIDLALYLLIRFVMAIVQALPEDRVARACGLMSLLLADVIPLRRRVLDDNLQRVFPAATNAQSRAMRRKMWKHLLLMACEVAWAPRKIHRTNWEQFIHFPDRKSLLQPILAGRPTVLVTGHFGNFEVAGYATGLFGIPTMTIARPLDNRFLDRHIAAARSAKGQQLVPKDGSAAIVDRYLSDGGTLSLLADQHAGTKGCWVDFLGHPASSHKALALFCLTGGAPMVVTYNRRLARPMQFELGVTGVADPRIDGPHLSGVRALTVWYNQRLADAIAKAPEQYWWVHRRWRQPPSPRPTRKAG
jgi:Kdo2-lipid IVA lauroyltransferase/acyltransferase